MARRPSTDPTEVELEILTALWDGGAQELGRVRDAVSTARGREVAKTTIATMLGVMLDKGLVRRERGGRGYLWEAAVSRNATSSGVLSRVIDRVFDGSAKRLVAHLIEDGRLTPQERREIQALLDHSRSSKGGDR